MAESLPDGSPNRVESPSNPVSDPNAAIPPMLLRVAYLTGSWYGRLFYCVHRDWLWAHSTDDGAVDVEQCFSQIRSGVSELRGVSSRDSSERALRALNLALKYFNKKFGGDDHDEFIERRERSERELLPAKWENDWSILRSRIWSVLRKSVAEYVGGLPSQLQACWTTGSLVAQVNLLLRGDDGSQSTHIGEEFPIPILQQNLIDLTREVKLFQGFNVLITKPRRNMVSYVWTDAVAKTRKLDEKIMARLQKAADSRLVSSDNESSPVNLDPGNQTCSVTIHNPDKFEVIVNNKVKTLKSARFDVIKALVDEFPDKLTKDQLIEKSKHSDAVNMLKAIAELDRDWKSVILLPGSPGKGYRLKGSSYG
jgi:hypothetical protein